MKHTPYKWKPDFYADKFSYVFELTDALVEMLNPVPGAVNDRTDFFGMFFAQQRGCEVVGVDLSPEMVATAKEKGVDARVMDGHSMAFEDEFDAVFSNEALHWMSEDPARVVQNVARALKKGGRFVAEFGGKGNVQKIMNATSSVMARRGMDLPEVWYYPSKESYVQLLESHGFKIKEANLFTRDTRCPAGPTGWLEVFGGFFFEGLSEPVQQEVIKEIGTEMEPLPVDEDGVYLADYKRLRIHAVKT